MHNTIVGAVITLLVVGFCFSLGYATGIYNKSVAVRECEAKGGKRLRGALEGYQCYDARTLAVLP